MSDKKSTFETLREVNVSSYLKSDQGGHPYLPWASCWGLLKEKYPHAVFEQHLNDVGDAFFVSSMGVEVRVTITINDESQTFTHPVLNSINKSMKLDGYSYVTKKGDRHVVACSTFDINSARARALVKCAGLHGLGLDVYSDDLQPLMETVDSRQLQSILDKIKLKNLSLAEVCTSWNLKKVAHLHEVNYDSFMAWLDGAK